MDRPVETSRIGLKWVTRRLRTTSGYITMRRPWALSGRPLSRGVVVLVLWAAAVVMQSIWRPSESLLIILLVILGGWLGTTVFLKREMLTGYPLSTSMLLGFTTFYFLLPPVATLLEGKPLASNLENPVLVFVHALVCLFFLAGAHLVYRNWYVLQDLRWLVARRIYGPAGFYRTPSNLHLLAMGSIGLVATYYQIVALGGSQGLLLGAGNKLMQALFILTYLPLAMLVRRVLGGRRGISRGWMLVLAGYTVLLLGASVARNSRTVYLQGLAAVALVYLYGLAVGIFDRRGIDLKKLVLTAVGAVVLAGPFTDLATSIVLVRRERREISGQELVLRTFETFRDKDGLRERLLKLEDRSVWDEYYVDNQYLARLANLKYPDNSIGLARSISSADRRYFRELELQRSLSALPRPVLSLLGLGVDKDFIGGASGGDLLLYTATGRAQVLGGYRVGSIFGSGYAIFGWGYPLVLALITPLIFALADSLTSRKRVDNGRSESGEWIPILSPMAVIGFFSWFSYFTSAARGVDSFSGLSFYLLRGWLEVLVVYAFAYWATLPVMRAFETRRQR